MDLVWYSSFTQPRWPSIKCVTALLDFDSRIGFVFEGSPPAYVL